MFHIRLNAVISELRRSFLGVVWMPREQTHYRSRFVCPGLQAKVPWILLQHEFDDAWPFGAVSLHTRERIRCILRSRSTHHAPRVIIHNTCCTTVITFSNYVTTNNELFPRSPWPPLISQPLFSRHSNLHFPVGPSCTPHVYRRNLLITNLHLLYSTIVHN